MSKEIFQSDNIKKTNKFKGLRQSAARKTASVALLTAAIGFPGVVYYEAQANNEIEHIDERLHETLDNSTAKAILGTTLIAGVATTLNAHYAGKKYDEDKLHALRVTGPALLTAAAGSALIDSQFEISSAIPATLLFTGSYAQAATGIISTHQRTTDEKLRNTSIASGAGMVGLGATAVLAIADKI